MSFTPKELGLLRDTNFFAAKAVISEKIKQFLERLQTELKKELAGTAFLAPEGVDLEKGQLVKGEHLLDFPYQYLDLPKFFSHAEKFTFRTLFWWGHHLVFAFILEGRYLDRYKENLIRSYRELADQGLYLLLAPTPWEWKKEPQYLLEIKKENRSRVTETLASLPFLKIHHFVDFNSQIFEEGNLVQAGVKTFRLMKPIVLR